MQLRKCIPFLDNAVSRDWWRSQPGLVAQSCNPATWEARTWDGLRLPGLTSPFGRWINISTLGL